MSTNRSIRDGSPNVANDHPGDTERRKSPISTPAASPCHDETDDAPVATLDTAPEFDGGTNESWMSPVLETPRARAYSSEERGAMSASVGRPPLIVTTLADTDNTSVTEGTAPVSPATSTIPVHRRVDSSDANSLPSLSGPIQPAHPFFSPSFFEESDASDGSIVFQPPTPQRDTSNPDSLRFTGPQHVRRDSRGRDGRDRFPSFDSLGSSGSIRIVPPSNSSQIMRGKEKFSASSNSLPANPAPVIPSLPTIGQLPYHERRKLMAQRAKDQQQQLQLQQQQLQLQQHRPHIPPNLAPMPLPAPTLQHLPHQQQHQNLPQITPHTKEVASPYGQNVSFPPHQPQHPQPQAHPHHYIQNLPSGHGPHSGIPLRASHGPPPPPLYAYPVPQVPLGPYPPPPLQQYYGHLPPPSSQQQQLQSLWTRNNPLQTADKVASDPRQQQHIYRTSGNHHQIPLPPRGGSHSRNNSSTIGLSSNMSSSDGDVERKPSARVRPEIAPAQPPLPPPPPPPGLPPNYAHMRTDSSGSLSSLGSFDRPAKIEPRKASFLEKLNPWSPKVPNVNDYHRKNQQFLRRASVERGKLWSTSPQTPAGRRKPSVSTEGPPPTRGSHKRLNSIDGDDWEERPESLDTVPYGSKQNSADPSDQLTVSSDVNSSEDNDVDSLDSPQFYGHGSRRGYDGGAEPNERSNLLPPPGLNTSEYYDKSNASESRAGLSSESSQRRQSRRTNWPNEFQSASTERRGNTTGAKEMEYLTEKERRKLNRKKKKKKKKHERHSRKARGQSGSSEEESSSSVSASSASSHEYQRWMKKRARMLEKERSRLIKQWRAEAFAEERSTQQHSRWYHRFSRYQKEQFGEWVSQLFRFFIWLESFVANLPLTIGAIALAVANLGVDWFKFAEENMDSCEPVHFHSSQCTFPEFPGCFYCDTSARMYKVALNFHFACSIIAGVIASTFIAKLILARRVVFDELSSPTTATPAGLLCMTLNVVFAGRGLIGQVVVSLAGFIHLCLAIWFIYMALAYRIMPEPSWFPNTVSIGLSAVKIWLYYPMAGHFLMAISLSLNFFFFPISLIRVAMNRKISATVGWMQMSAPNISLYAMTLMAQPSFKEEHPDINRFQVVHRMVYLPCMHFFFGLCIVGMLASVHSLLVRWTEFRKLPFSPAHAAFCVPTLSHANAIQAYRAAVNSFSKVPVGSPFRSFLYVYWVFVLIAGTFLTLWIATKFMWSLPGWTHIDTAGEMEPPAPYETAMTSSNLITTGESLVQPFISPAILQANETGALVVSRDQYGAQVYRRTRMVTALGFEPIMNQLQMDVERELLLDWVGKNPPRRRHRTLSVPGIDFTYGATGAFGAGNAGVYGMDEGTGSPWFSRPRANTSSPNVSHRYT